MPYLQPIYKGAKLNLISNYSTVDKVWTKVI